MTCTIEQFGIISQNDQYVVLVFEKSVDSLISKVPNAW